MSVRIPVAALLAVLLAVLAQAQDGAPATPLTLLTRDGRRPVPTTLQGGREIIALDDVAALFQVAVRDDALAGGVTVSYRGRSIVASANRSTASIDGRIVTLPSPVVRSGRRWLVPVEFLSVALSAIYDQRIELRRPSRLLIVGDVRIPRVSVTVTAQGSATHADVEVTPAAKVDVTTAPGRLQLRVDADAVDLAPTPDNQGLVERVRTEPPNLLTMALGDGAAVPRATVTVVGNSTRVAIDITASTPEPRAPTPEPRAPATESRVPSPEPRPGGPEPSVPSSDSRTWRTIVIDPGHGGDDVGARSEGGLEEKQLTLDVARRLRTMVENRLGLRVILTRDDDRSLGLDERASMANNGKADLLLSLHVNSTRVPDQSGAEVFHLLLDPEAANAVRSAAESGAVLPALGGGVRHLDLIPWDLAQARHLDESAVLAGVLNEELQRQVPMSTRPVRQAPMRLLAAANMPAALVEMAYLSNPDQEARLKTDDFKSGMAQAVFSAIVRFRAWSEEARQR